MILRVVRRWLLRRADRLERDWQGLYPVGTYGAEVLQLAANLRELARGLGAGPPPPVMPRPGGHP